MPCSGEPGLSGDQFSDRRPSGDTIERDLLELLCYELGYDRSTVLVIRLVWGGACVTCTEASG
jgi:hypothetical protein